MDDLSAAIRDLLQDPQSMAQIQSLAHSLGLNDAQQAPSNTVNPLQALLPAAASPAQNTDPMLSAIMRAAPLLAQVNEEDDAARLLSALRPLLSEARQKKLDDAGRILKLLHLLPLLRESGLLQNIL